LVLSPIIGILGKSGDSGKMVEVGGDQDIIWGFSFYSVEIIHCIWDEFLVYAIMW
jgi:hypothetical protein